MLTREKKDKTLKILFKNTSEESSWHIIGLASASCRELACRDTEHQVGLGSRDQRERRVQVAARDGQGWA